MRELVHNIKLMHELKGGEHTNQRWENGAEIKQNNAISEKMA